MSSTGTDDAAVTEITMPRLSDSMEEATIVAWLKRPGEAFARGDGLVEVETDKATIVYEAEADGVLVEVLVDEGGSAALGAPIARASLARAVASAAPSAPAAFAAAPPAGDRGGPAPVPAKTGRVRATPVARQLAAELGVELAGVVGTGPGGRIVRADVLGSAASAHSDDNGDRRISLTGTQRTIAKRMTASRAVVPDFTLTAEIDVTAALELRRELNELVPAARVSVNDLFVRGVAIALREFPRLNASYDGDAVVEHARVNIGVAVAADDALLVPVIRDADCKSLVEIAQATRAAGERARGRALKPSELEDGTFTITNLGMFGISSFQAVINPPQVAILAVGRIDRRPVFDDAGAVVARDRVHVSLSCDHRAVYGAEAARFLERVQRVVERPLELIGVSTGASHEADA